MATVSSASLKISSATGVGYDILRDRAKNLRHGALLPTVGTRGGGADQLEIPELLNLLLGALVTGRRDQTADAVRSVRTARFDKAVTEKVEQLADGSIQTKAAVTSSYNNMSPERANNLQPFGAFLEALIEQATTTVGRNQIETWLDVINVWEDGQRAMLRTNDRQQIWFEVPPDNGPPRTTYAPFPIRRLATVPGRIILVLADLALEARQAARNTKARNAGALQADVIVSPQSLNRKQESSDHTERESGRKARRGDIAEPEPPGIENNVRELKSA